MDKDFIKGVKIGVGFLTTIILTFFLLFGLVYAVGFHTANEILEGTFNGNYSFINGNVGIGTPTPTQKLEINGSINISSGALFFSDGTNQTTSSSETGKITGRCILGNAYGSATNCAIGQSNPYMTCSSGNTPIVFTFCMGGIAQEAGLDCQWNGAGYPMGICVKD